MIRIVPKDGLLGTIQNIRKLYNKLRTKRPGPCGDRLSAKCGLLLLIFLALTQYFEYEIIQ